MELISVIIPVYNAEKYIRKCVQSCLNQTYANIEIIVIDDGSSDQSADICDRFVEKDERVHVFHKENGGVSSARNIGLSVARGKFIIFVDADDWIEPDMVYALWKKQEEHKCDLVVCNYSLYVEGKKKRTGSKRYKNLESKKEILDYIIEPGNDDFIRGPVFKLYKADIIQTHAIIFNQMLTLGEDTVFNYQYNVL